MGALKLDNMDWEECPRHRIRYVREAGCSWCAAQPAVDAYLAKCEQEWEEAKARVRAKHGGELPKAPAPRAQPAEPKLLRAKDYRPSPPPPRHETTAIINKPAPEYAPSDILSRPGVGALVSGWSEKETRHYVGKAKLDAVLAGDAPAESVEVVEAEHQTKHRSRIRTPRPVCSPPIEVEFEIEEKPSEELKPGQSVLLTESGLRKVPENAGPFIDRVKKLPLVVVSALMRKGRVVVKVDGPLKAIGFAVEDVRPV